MTEDVNIRIKVDSTQAETGTKAVTSNLEAMAKAAAGLVALDKIKDFGVYAVKTADQFSALEGRLADVMEGFGNLETAMSSIGRISSATGADIQTVGKMFETVAESAKNAGRSSAEAEKLVETLSRLKASYNIEDAGFSSAMLQFNQALSTGILRGEEFNGVFEGASPIIRAMAKALDVNVGHMRALAEAGALTSEKIFLIATQLPDVTKKMNDAPKTIATEWGKLVSELDQSFISMNKNLNITEKIAASIGWIADKIKYIRNATEAGPEKIQTVSTFEEMKKRFPQSADSQINKFITAEKNIAEKQKAEKMSEITASIESYPNESARAKAEQDAKAKEERDRQAKNYQAYIDEAAAAGKNTPEAKAREAEKIAREEQRKNEELNAMAEQGEIAKLEQIRARHEKERELLEQHKQGELEILGRYGGLMREAEAIKNDSINGMDENTKKVHLSRLKNFGLQALNESGQYSKKMFEISKAANLADAIVTGYAAVNKAYNTVPVPYNFAVAALTAAQVAIQVRGIQSQKYGGGGGFSPAGGASSGGASPVGFGAISEQFGDNKKEAPSKSVTINITGDGTFSSQQVRELIKKIGEEAGSNVVIQAA
jgi:tape measure domain-containing protein